MNTCSNLLREQVLTEQMFEKNHIFCHFM
ncbi:hypothetical protein LMED105_02408 [Limnobacter sp. MED105]|nr:hypothetical protein LMED105_02408 [Limnobacter sp. MED105]